MLDLKLLGNRIRVARERAGISQWELADKLGKDQRSISQYENGKRKVLITDLSLLAQILHMPIRYFFEGEEVLDDYDTRLLAEFGRLNTDGDRASIIEIVRVFCDALERKQ